MEKENGGEILSIKRLIYKESCLTDLNLNIARDKEYEPHLLVNEKIKSIFEKEKITGVSFVRPEDYC